MINHNQLIIILIALHQAIVCVSYNTLPAVVVHLECFVLEIGHATSHIGILSQGYVIW